MAEEKEKNKFKISDGEIDRDKLLDIVAKNADDYALWRLQRQPGKKAILKKNRQAAFNVEGFLSALNDVTTAISEGKLTRGAGNVYTHSDGIVWNDPEHRAALDLVNRGIDTIGKLKEENKKKYSSTSIKDRFNNKFYGGNFTGSEADWQIWKDKKTGVSDLASMINDEITDLQNNDELDYEGSPYKNRDEHLARLTKLRDNLNNGTLDDSDLADWVSVGGDGDFFKNVTGLKSEEKRENPNDAAWKEEELKLIDAGFTPQEIAQRKTAWYEQLKDSLDPDRHKRAYLQNFDNFVTNHWTGTSRELANLGIDTYDRNFFTGTKGLDEGDSTPGWFDNTNNQNYADSLYKKALKGESISGKTSDGVSNAHILREYMYMLSKKKNYITPINSDEFFVNSTFDLNSGSAVKYNKNTRQFTRVHVNPQNTPILLKKLKEMYKKQNLIQSTNQQVSSFGSILKNGGVVNKLQTLRNITKAGFGAEIARINKKEREDKYNKAIAKESTEHYGDASAENISRTKLGHQDAFTSESQSRKNGIQAGMDNSDWLRLTSALTDLASIGVSYTGAGMPVAGAMQVGSTALDLAADVTDSTMTWGDVAKNLAMNVGLGVATTFGAGAVAKAGKIGKTIARLLPVGLAAYGATNLLLDEGFKKTVNKIGSGQFNKLTSNDMKNINIAMKIISGGHHAAKSAAGSLGTMYGKNSTVMRRLGRWGTNSYTSEANAMKALRNATTTSGGRSVVDPSKLTASQRNTLLYLTALNKGGFKSGVPIKLLSNGKVNIGGIEVEKETALAMEAARKKASSIPGAKAETVKNAILDAYRNSAEGKATIKAGSPAIAAHTVNAFTAANETDLLTALTPQAEGTGFKINGETFEGTKEFENQAFGANKIKAGDLTSKLQEIYKAKADATTATGTPDEIAAAKHAAGLAEVNKVFGELFNTLEVPATPETGMPTFDLSGVEGNKGKWDLRRFGGRGSLNYSDTNPGWIKRSFRAINPERTDILDVSTPEGRANVQLLRELRLYQNPNNIFSNNTEYVNGFGVFNTDISSLSQAMRDFGLAKRKAEHEAALQRRALRQALRTNLTQNEIDAKKLAGEKLRFLREITRTPELASMSDEHINTFIENYKAKTGFTGTNTEALRAAKQEVLLSGRTLKSVLRNPAPKTNPREAFTPKFSARTHQTYGSKIHTTNTTDGTTATKLNTYQITKSRDSILPIKHNPSEVARKAGMYQSKLSSDALALLKSKGVNLKDEKANLLRLYNQGYLKRLLGLLNNLTIHAAYKAPSGEYYWWKQGGKIQLLKELRNSNFTIDNSNSSDELSKFAKGGIIKAAGGAELTDDAYVDDVWKGAKIGDIRYMNNTSGNGLSVRLSKDKATDKISPGNNYYDPVSGVPNGENNDNKGYWNYMYNNPQEAEKWARGYRELVGKTTDIHLPWFDADDKFQYDKFKNDVTSKLWSDQKNGPGHDVYKGKIFFIKDKDGNKKYVKYNDSGYNGYTASTTASAGINPLIEEYELTKNETPAEPVEILTSGGSTGDPGLDYSKTADKFNLGLFFNALRNGIPTAIASARLFRNLRNNHKLAELAKLKNVALLSPIYKHRNVYGDFAALQEYARQGSEYSRRANEIANSTNNVELGALAKLEGQMKKNASDEKGFLADNAKIAETKEAANKVANEVYDYNHKVADENMSRFVAKHNADIDTDMGERSANNVSLNNASMQLENELKTANLKSKNDASQLAQYDMENWWSDNVTNTPEIQALKEKYAKETNAAEANKILNEISAKTIANQKANNALKREWGRRLLSGDYTWRPEQSSEIKDYTMKNGYNDGFTMKTKNGGKLDSSRMKYHAEDLRELRKLIKHNIDSNQKALDNLSRATLLELKKMMGI